MRSERESPRDAVADATARARSLVRTERAGLTALDAAGILRALERCVAENGLRDGLRFLNARTRYRFTGVYRYDPPVLRNVALFDRENPSVHVCGDIHSLHETYCSIVRATGAPFATEDASRDDRVQTHPARDRFMSYCGVPLKDPDGTTFGVLCHFDLRPRAVPDEEILLLEAVAENIGRIVMGSIR